jgi:glycosyltransferase involved in cell wall biosynthesis
MKLLHLTYDYPDVINPDKTRAIKNIIDITKGRTNTCCISLNRTAKFKKAVIYRNDNILALNTFGLPKGIFFMFTLLKSINRVLSTGLDFKTFDRVHAHKLTFEGPIAYYLHRRFNLPYIITIQQTDFKVLKYKPLMKSFYFKILNDARNIILISPWMERQLYKVFSSRRMKLVTHKLRSIPLIVDRKYVQRDYENGKFICVFHMRDSYIKIKNIYRVLKAISILKKAGIIICLDIAGDGPVSSRVEYMINRLGINSQVKMLGRVENDRIVDLMSEYRAFILCSYPETFGIVYIEALSAGIPVIYSKNAGIDGFFNDKGIGIAVQHENIKEICDALYEMNSNQNFYRKNVLKIQENKCLEMFSRASVQQKYRSVILGSLEK